jgi:hypothetical protein
MSDDTLLATILITLLLYIVYAGSTPSCLHIEGVNVDGTKLHLRFYDRAAKIYFFMYIYPRLLDFHERDIDDQNVIIEFIDQHTKFTEYDIAEDTEEKLEV